MKEVCEKCLPLFETLLKRIEKLEEKNCSLEKRLLAYENAHTPPSLLKKKRIPRVSSGKLGAPKGHEKYEREEPNTTETKKYTTKTCPHCSCNLGKPTNILRFIEEELPDLQSIKVIEHLIECFKCKNCGREIVSENDAPSSRVIPLLKELIVWYNQYKTEYPEILLAAVVHNQFENIHPFADGNGRVGRILLNNILLKKGLLPLNIDLKNQREYYQTLQFYEKQGDIRSTIELILKEYKNLKKIIK